MWTVIKYKNNQLDTVKKSFYKVLGNKPEFYAPKIKYTKYINNKLKEFEQHVLGDYLFCEHENFIDSKIINQLRNSRGLTYFLNGCESNQKELKNFINFCKSNEDSCGYLKQSFFNDTKKTKGKFISGPFTQMMFDILDRKEKRLKILINNINITISKNSRNLFYSYI